MNALLAYLHRKSREKKYRLFQQLLEPTAEMRILNVGATGTHIGLAEQLETFYPHRPRVVGGGPFLPDARDYRRSFPGVQAVVFDGLALPFADQSFDIVYSNAVLEHLESWEAQQALASEVQRVGRGWFVTVPNLWYPIEPHYHLPLVQFLPQSWQQGVARAFGKTPYPVLRPLGKRQLRRLFPGSQVIGCRVTFSAETLIAYCRPGAKQAASGAEPSAFGEPALHKLGRPFL